MFRNIELVKASGSPTSAPPQLGDAEILTFELKKVKASEPQLRSGRVRQSHRTGILFLMLYLIFAQQISVGQFFSLLIYSFFIFGPLQEIGNVINIFRETEASLETFQKILDMPVDPKPASPVAVDDLRVLDFDDVTFMHQTASAPALADITFRVERGETVAFVGPSGSGKTTLVSCSSALPTQTGRCSTTTSTANTSTSTVRQRIGLRHPGRNSSGSIRV
jgi:ATP-binding cassette subfamily B protein